MTGDVLAVIVDAVIAVVIIAAATVLLALSKIDSTTALALYGVGVAQVGGSAKSLLALRVPAPAQRTSTTPAP